MTRIYQGMEERETSLQAGRSPRRERCWGWTGAIVGVLAGVGSGLIAVYLDGASWTENTGYYPFIFTKKQFLF